MAYSHLGHDKWLLAHNKKAREIEAQAKLRFLIFATAIIVIGLGPITGLLAVMVLTIFKITP